MSSIKYFNSLDISKYCFEKCFTRFERKLYNKKIDGDAMVFGGKCIARVCELFFRSLIIYHDNKETVIADSSIEIVLFTRSLQIKIQMFVQNAVSN